MCYTQAVFRNKNAQNKERKPRRYRDTKRKKGIIRKNTERKEPRINANEREFFRIRNGHEIAVSEVERAACSFRNASRVQEQAGSMFYYANLSCN